MIHKTVPRICALGLTLLTGVIHSAPTISAKDPDTQSWWRLTTALSGDDMKGRDTGSPEYARAAAFVAARFQTAALRPAGDGGRYTQSVPLHEVRVEKDGTRVALIHPGGESTVLEFLHEISVRPTSELPSSLEAAMTFRGYCAPADMDTAVKGKIAVCFAARRKGLPTAAERLKAAEAAGAVGLIAVDDRGFTVEPPRWPEAYARAVTLRGTEPPTAARLAVMRLNSAVFAKLIDGSDQDAERILVEGAALRVLPHFELAARLRAQFRLSDRDYSSDNVLALMPGTDPALNAQVIVVSAHLDGYGIGEPVAGDAIYNGTFDDAAYVATLIRLAQKRRSVGFRRAILFAVMTGEEKGLLGSSWFAQHPTVPVQQLAADINLDAVRPLFPLKILTAISMSESTLGETARAVGAKMNIEVRADQEPERGMRQRTDHWSFLKTGIPAICFMFGFDPGSDAELRYRAWYETRYHKPQDDLSQPFDVKAAGDFNEYFYRLVQTVADAPARPAIVP